MNFFNSYLPKIIALCQKHKVKKLFAFGSVLTNRFTDKSDIDLVVDFDYVSLEDYADNYFDLKYALENLFSREVDLLEDKAIRNPYLKENVDATKIQLYGLKQGCNTPAAAPFIDTPIFITVV